MVDEGGCGEVRQSTVDCVPEEECSVANEVARSGNLELGCFTKYHEVPGGSDGTVCQRMSAQLRVRMPGQGAWSLVLFQSTMKYQGALVHPQSEASKYGALLTAFQWPKITTRDHR